MTFLATHHHESTLARFIGAIRDAGAQTARQAAINECEHHLKRARRHIGNGDFRAARKAACKALGCANVAKLETRSAIFSVLNACQNAARVRGGANA